MQALQGYGRDGVLTTAEEEQSDEQVRSTLEELEDRERSQRRGGHRDDEPANVVKWPAPSIFADSMTALGKDDM